MAQSSNCHFCNKIFTIKPGTRGKYCSLECSSQDYASVYKDFYDAKKQSNINKYLDNPKRCLHCESIIPYDNRLNKFCNHSCSATYYNTRRPPKTKETKAKLSQKIIEFRSRNDLPLANVSKVKWSKVTGRPLGKGNTCFWDSNPAKITFGLKLCKWFNLVPGKYPETEIELNKICAEIKHQYIDNLLSAPEIKIKFNIPLDIGHMTAFLKQIGVESRNQSLARAIAISQEKGININNRYKTGHHLDWRGKWHFFRSGYELNFYKVLDTKRKIYETEAIKVEYLDSRDNKIRLAIPDIIIGKMIIEIKGSYTYDSINMADKFKAYKKLGYRPVLILGKKIVKQPY